MSKPRIFIGSSRENIGLSRAIQAAFDYEAEVVIWDQGTFGVSEYPLESLEKELDLSDFGIFIFFPDDVTIMRGEKKGTVRDNVIFELGLFLGRLGRRRTFIVVPRGADLHFPTDLTGLTPVDYESERADGNLLAAIGTASTRIRDAMKAQPLRAKTSTATVQDSEKADEQVKGDAAPAALSPQSNWKLKQYERAYAIACISYSEAEKTAIDSAFRASKLAGSDEALTVWDAWRDYIQMLKGQGGTVASLRNKAAAFPNNARLQVFLGDALSHYGDPVGASGAYREALEKAGDVVTAARAAGLLAEISSDTAIHAESIRSRLVAFPAQGIEEKAAIEDALRKIAGSQGLERVGRAIDEIRIKARPENTSIRFELAHSHDETEDHDLALLHYQRIPAPERSGTVWNNLGVAFDSLQMPGRAVAAYKVASREGETIADGNLAQKLVRAGFFEEAQKQAEAAVVVQGHHQNVVEALSAVQDAKSAEDDSATQARAIAIKKQEFLIRLGEASLATTGVDVIGLWNAPECPVELRKTEDGQYVALGKFEREVGGLGLFAPLKRSSVQIVEYRLRRFGNAFEGTVIQKAEDPQPLTLLGGITLERKIALYVSGDGQTMAARVFLSGSSWEEVEWLKARLPALVIEQKS